MRSLLSSLLFTLTVLASEIAMAKIYTWTDENGKRHYSDSPPAKASDLEEKKVETSSYAFASKPISTKTEADEIDEGTELSGLPDKDPARCAQAKEHLKFMNEAPRIRMKGEDGELQFLDDTQRQAEKDKAQKVISAYC